MLVDPGTRRWSTKSTDRVPKKRRRAARCRPAFVRCPDIATSRVNTTALLATGDDDDLCLRQPRSCAFS
jgi:hypothetical protein